MYNTPKNPSPRSKKMAEAHATALVFTPIKLNPKRPPAG
jgi:hypothetical protein